MHVWNTLNIKDMNLIGTAAEGDPTRINCLLVFKTEWGGEWDFGPFVRTNHDILLT